MANHIHNVFRMIYGKIFVGFSSVTLNDFFPF
jgi:hypothetical protein